MEGSERSWCQPIHSEILKTLFESVTEEMSLPASESSFAHQLLNEIKKDQFIRNIKALATRVQLNRADNTEADQDEHGKVYVWKVQVKRRKTELTVEKEVITFFFTELSHIIIMKSLVSFFRRPNKKLSG